MNAIGLYLGGLGLFCLAALLIRNTDPHLTKGGSHYEVRKQRRLVGNVLIVVGLFLVGLGVLTQFFSGHVPVHDSQPVTSASSTSSQHASSSLPGGASAIHSSPAVLSQAQTDAANHALREAFQMLQQKQLDEAMDKVNAVIQIAPQNPNAYAIRGGIYAERKQWGDAEKDYQTAHQLDDKNVQMTFDLAELSFMQKKYDAARPGFLALQKDSDVGDLSAYKAFLCDLFGAHEDVAAKELDAFNQAGSNASYYFSNAAWDLYHQKTEDARGWLMSAANIYAPDKFKLYAASLIDLGYMPLPPPPQP